VARKRIDLFDPQVRRAVEARAERRADREKQQQIVKARNARKLAAERRGALAPSPLHPTEKAFADAYPERAPVPAPPPAPPTVIVEAPAPDARLADAIEKMVAVQAAELALKMVQQERVEKAEKSAPPAVHVTVQQGATETVPIRDKDGLIERSITRPLSGT
jgi:hypothetical protein